MLVSCVTFRTPMVKDPSMKSFRIPNKKLEIIEKLYVGVHMYFLGKESPNFYQITMEMVHPFMKKNPK